jgi:Ca-activated chloride channel family protein
MFRHTRRFAFAGGTALAFACVSLHGQEDFRFRSSVELVNVTATVTDRSGRFVSGLQPGDFTMYEDDRQVEISHFTAARVPVSLGIVLDTSGSMAGEKITNARAAIERFLDRLLNPDDEVFLYTFDYSVRRLRDWTSDRGAVSASLGRMRANGGTAMYDAVIDALPTAESGRNDKKALLLISDGNDTSSRGELRHVRQEVRESDVLVYAIGIDGRGESTPRARRRGFPRIQIPFPFQGRQRPGPSTGRRSGSERLNASALRAITDDTGGRTEVIRNTRDLDPATSGIADELSRQYFFGYASPAHRDGRWHTIRVEPRDRSLRVRARRGYVAAT